MAFELGSELLSAAVGLGMGGALKVGYDRSKRLISKDRPLRKIWGFLQQPTYIFLPILNASGVGAAGGYGDLLALSAIIRVANRYFPSANSIVVQTDQSKYREISKENLVVIGGGKYNAVYRELIDLLRVPFHFFDSPSQSFLEIRNAERSTVFAPTIDASGNVTQDIGLAVVANNPLQRDKKIVLTAGAHTYGSAAAMQYLTERGSLREIAQHSKSNIQIIVGCKVENHTPFNVHPMSQILEF